jgi:hypothetical protein
VADRRVGEHLLGVTARDRLQRPVGDAHRPDGDQREGPELDLAREDRRTEAQQAVDADVRQGAGEHRGDRRRDAHVDGRQPEVEREQPELDAERDEQRDRDEDRRVGAIGAAARRSRASRASRSPGTGRRWR